jgi:hypothetical protein
MRWVGHGEQKGWELHTKLWIESLKGKHNLEDVGVDYTVRSIVGTWEVRIGLT